MLASNLGELWCWKNPGFPFFLVCINICPELKIIMYFNLSELYEYFGRLVIAVLIVDVNRQNAMVLAIRSNTRACKAQIVTNQRHWKSL